MPKYELYVKKKITTTSGSEKELRLRDFSGKGLENASNLYGFQVAALWPSSAGGRALKSGS